VYGSRLVVDDHRHVIDAWPAAEGSQVRSSLATFNALGGPSGVVVRSDVMATTGGFDERLSALADWEAWIRVLEVCDAAPVPEFLVAYTVYADNMHIRDPRGYLAEFAVLTQLLRERPGGITGVDEAGFVRWLAEEVARAGKRRTAAELWLRSALIGRKPLDVLRAGAALMRDRAPEGTYAASPDWLSALAQANGHALRRQD
jgi:hypothetical protein